LSKEGEVLEVIHRWHDSRDIGLWEEILQGRLNVTTGIDLVVGELLARRSTNDIIAGVLGGCGG
jgi:hypothetical protein